MKKFNYTINDKMGIHTRQAVNLARECEKYQSDILIKNITKFIILKI